MGRHRGEEIICLEWNQEIPTDVGYSVDRNQLRGKGAALSE